MNLTRVWDKQEKKIIYVKTKYVEDDRFVYDYELIYFKAKEKDRYINIDKNPELLEVKV